MAQVFDFPLPRERDWKFWETAVRDASKGTPFDSAVVDVALPAIKEHWEAVFQEVAVEVSPRPFPSPLTKEQAAAIQETIDAHVQAVVTRLKHERHTALGRLVQVELSLAYYRVRGGPA